MHRLLLLLCVLWSGAVQAAPLDYQAFETLPLQHEGRIKPLNTFAALSLEQIHGAAHLNGAPAIAWLAQSLFDPVKAMGEKLFLLDNADAQAMLSLPARPDRLYSFMEVSHAFETNAALIRSLRERPADGLSPEQRDVLKLYENAEAFNQILLSATLFLPIRLDIPEAELSQLGLAEINPPTFLDYYPHLSALKHRQAAETLAAIEERSHGNTLLRVIPPAWGGEEWLSPWAVFHSGQGAPQTAEALALWRHLALAYQTQDAPAWSNAARALQERGAQAAGVRPAALALEVSYYRYDPLGKTMLLYAAGLVLTLLSLARKRSARVALAVTASGAALHIASIAARVYILERPPVGTLYESMLFVSAVCVLFGLGLEWRLKSTVGLLAATLSGSVLLCLSQYFGQGDDTMSMLIAVLNTNFWLATHVLCITAGYGFGIIAGIIAHVHLLLRMAGHDTERARRILRGGYATALIALLFTALGTILGGIWADQSWGRFWGWDPKENGALLICLWLIWLLHGRISSRLHERGFAVGLALLNVVIALSWLGVNLLSTGLHSYGFTNKAAWGLGGFCAAECAFAAAAYAMLLRRDHAEAL